MPLQAQGLIGNGDGHQRRASDDAAGVKVKSGHSADGSGQSDDDEEILGAVGGEEVVGMQTRSATAKAEAAK